MSPALIEEPPQSAAPAPVPEAAASVLAPLRDCLLSLEQCAELLGESLQETRALTSVQLLKHEVVDGQRRVWLSDLLTYKRDFDRAFAEYLADPLNTPCEETPNPVDVLPEYAHMRLPCS